LPLPHCTVGIELDHNKTEKHTTCGMLGVKQLQGSNVAMAMVGFCCLATETTKTQLTACFQVKKQSIWPW